MKLIKSKSLLKVICLILIFISLIMGINLVYAYGMNTEEDTGTKIEIMVAHQMLYLKERPIHIITIDKTTKEVVESTIYDMNGTEPKLFAEVRKGKEGGEMWVLDNHPNMWKVGKTYRFKAVVSSSARKDGSIEYEDLEFDYPIVVPGLGSQRFEIEMKRKQPTETKPEPPTNKPGGGDGTTETPSEGTSEQPSTGGPGETETKPPVTEKPVETTTSEGSTSGPEVAPPDQENPGTPGEPGNPPGGTPGDSGTNVPGQQQPGNSGNAGNTGGNTGNTGGNNQIDNNNRGDGIITSDSNIENTTESTPTDQTSESKLQDAISEIYIKLQETIDKAINKIKEDLGQTIDKIKEEMPDISISKPGFGFDNNKMFSLLLMLIVLLPAIGLALREILKNRWAILAFFKRKKILLIVGEDILPAEYIAENFLENSTKVEIEENIFMYKGIYEGRKVSVMNSEDMESITETDYYELHKKYNVKNIARLERTIGIDSGEFELFDLILINKDWNNGKRKSSKEVDEFIKELTERLNKSITDLIELTENVNILEEEEDNLVSIEMEVIDLVTKEKNSDYNIAFLLKIARSLLTEENRQILAEDMIEIILDLVSEFK